MALPSSRVLVSEGPARIILVRRDNIGDLVCTTPLIFALRQRFPNARIAVYVNSYHRAVLDGNPDIDEIHVYTKRKHLPKGFNPLTYYWHRARQIWQLRAAKFDEIIIAEPGYIRRLVRASRVLKPRRIVGFADAQGKGPGLDVCVKRGSSAEVSALHEVEDLFRLGRVYGIQGSPPPLRVFASTVPDCDAHAPLWGVHVSARKPGQRWPAERFVKLIRALHEATGAHIRLFWAPGAANDPHHPGDDDKARAILDAVTDLPVIAHPSRDLRSLIDGLAACHAVLCSDGGAMHIAAGLGKPIVCLFGNSDPLRWHPWGVRHELLQKNCRDVAKIEVEEVLAACKRILNDPN